MMKHKRAFSFKKSRKPMNITRSPSHTPVVYTDPSLNPYLRQLDFYDPAKHTPRVTVVGAGGIGSWVVLQLAKLGVKRITVYDHDVVKTHNLSTTPYGVSDVGEPKVKALSRLARPFGNHTKIVGKPRLYKRQSLKHTDILISAVDSIETRRRLFKEAERQKVPLFLDGRVGGENLRVYAVRPGRRKDGRRYRKTLLPPQRIAPLSCYAQGVIDVQHVTAALLTRAVRKWVVEGKYIPELIAQQATLQMMSASPEQEGRQ